MGMKPCSTPRRIILDRLDYDPLTGVFLWRATPDMPARWNTRFAGKPAGTMAFGRLWIRVNYERYAASRLAWLYVHGVWPEHLEIDHINCDPSDNRIANLRVASRAQNQANIRCPSHNTSGLKGVSWDKSRRKWLAFTWAGNKFKNLGRFETKESASAAYMSHMKSCHGSFARAA